MKEITFTGEEAQFIFNSLHSTWHKLDDELQEDTEEFRKSYIFESKNIAKELMNKISKRTF